jgi:hypothetical protein
VSEPVVDHWKRLKILALASLFRRQVAIWDDLDSTIAVMGLPEPVADAARKNTGIVNF